MDIVGGAVASLCEVYREVTRFDQAGHWINLLFDHETDAIQVESPYTHPALRIRVKRPAPLFVRIPPWLQPSDLDLSAIGGPWQFSNSYLCILQPPINRWLTIRFPLKQQTITLNHRTRQIRARLRGDEVVAMDNFGADLTFFSDYSDY